MRDPAFRKLVVNLDGGPIHASPPATLMIDGEVAFARMREAVDAAREEILLETYILRDDRLGNEMRQALLNAAARGVRVAVLADAIGSMKTTNRFWHSLTKGGVNLRLFHKVWSHPLEALRRDHRKLLIIDRLTGFTGGMNIGEEYGTSIFRHRLLEQKDWRAAWRDSFILLHGTAVRELAAVFAEGWDKAGGPPLPGLEYVSWAAGSVRPPEGWKNGILSPRLWQARWQRQIGLHYDRTRGRRVRPHLHQYQTPEDTPGCVVLAPRPGRAQKETLTVLAALVGATRRRFWITTPYFAPPTRALRYLAAAATRGVDVRLLLPGTLADIPILRHAAHGAYSQLLARGVRIFEYQKATLHAKTLVVDSHASMLGSSNLDFRSFWLNAECNVLVFDDQLGHDMDQAFLEDLSDSKEITPESWRKRTPAHRALDKAARAIRWAL